MQVLLTLSNQTFPEMFPLSPCERKDWLLLSKLNIPEGLLSGHKCPTSILSYATIFDMNFVQVSMCFCVWVHVLVLASVCCSICVYNAQITKICEITSELVKQCNMKCLCWFHWVWSYLDEMIQFLSMTAWRLLFLQEPLWTWLAGHFSATVVTSARSSTGWKERSS